MCYVLVFMMMSDVLCMYPGSSLCCSLVSVHLCVCVCR